MDKQGVYIQIGTNNGNDNFRRIVENNKPSKVILVEPNTNLIEQIKYNYRDIPNVEIINKALYYDNNSIISLYISAKDRVPNTPSPNGITYSDAHYTMFPMNDFGDKKDLIEIKAETITFDKICDDASIKDIYYLQIDTEGFDSEIISMINLEKYNIKHIRYEKWNFDTNAFTKFNKSIAFKLGKNGMKLAKEKLINNGYTLHDINDSDGQDIIAIKN